MRSMLGLQILLSGILVCGCGRALQREAILSGRVISADQEQPIADARVTFLVPAVEWRDYNRGHKPIFEGKTDIKGSYRMRIPIDQAVTTASVNVFARGYLTCWNVDDYCQGTVPDAVVLTAGDVQVKDIKLRRGIYFSGTVVDEAGRGIHDVFITSNYLCCGPSGAKGDFEIFDMRLDGGFLNFVHPDYINDFIGDVLAIPEAKRDQMRIVLKSGAQIDGVLIDINGRPVANVLVQTIDGPSPFNSKGKLTDANGHFSIKGLDTGKYTIRARDNFQKGVLQVDARNNSTAVVLKMIESIKKVAAPTIELFGMQVADADQALAEYFEVPVGSLVVLEPGKEVDRLGIPGLQVGSRFVTIEGADYERSVHVTDLRTFVEAIHKESVHLKDVADGHHSSAEWSLLAAGNLEIALTPNTSN
jgi:hypothetical protein